MLVQGVRVINDSAVQAIKVNPDNASQSNLGRSHSSDGIWIVQTELLQSTSPITVVEEDVLNTRVSDVPTVGVHVQRVQPAQKNPSWRLSLTVV